MINIDNLMMIHGRIVRDLKLEENKSGTKYTKFSVAVDRRGKNGDITDFIDCVAFNKNAEMLVEYFRKGKPIRAVGSMECDPYTARDGTKRYPWTLKVECWGFDAADPKGTVTENKPDVSEAFEEVDDPDDVPF